MEGDRPQFERDVFRAELKEVCARRRRLGIEAETLDGGPAPSTRLGLAGLAISGGGIRSATFSLGVIQALAKHGLLKRMDYLSTVSGGGYTGSCLSSVLNAPSAGPEVPSQENPDPKPAPYPLYRSIGAAEPPAIGQLRDSSNYLAPGGFMDRLRLPALLLRGVVDNFLVFLLPILLLVPLTELIYRIAWSTGIPLHDGLMAGLAGFLFLVLTFPFAARILGRRADWGARDRAERAFTVGLLLLLAALLLVPLAMLIGQAMETTWTDLRNSVVADLRRPFETRDIVRWAVLLGVLLLFVLGGRASERVSRLSGKLLLAGLGLLGPAVLLLVYLGLLILQVDTPFVSARSLFELDAQDIVPIETTEPPQALRERFARADFALSPRASIEVRELGKRWLLRDGPRAFVLERDHGRVRVTPDFEYALSRGVVSPELGSALQSKGYILSKHPRVRREQTRPGPAAQQFGERYVIEGTHRLGVTPSPSAGVRACGVDSPEYWTLSQVVSPPFVEQALRMAASNIVRASEHPPRTLIHEGVGLSDGDAQAALRFLGDGVAQDVVLAVDEGVDAEVLDRALERSLRAAPPTPLTGARLSLLVYGAGVGGPIVFSRPSPEPLSAALAQARETSRPSPACTDGLSGAPAALRCALDHLVCNGREGAGRSVVLIGAVPAGREPEAAATRAWLARELAVELQLAKTRLFGIELSPRSDDDSAPQSAKDASLLEGPSAGSGGALYPVLALTPADTERQLGRALHSVLESLAAISPDLEPLCLADEASSTVYALYRDGRFVRIDAAVRVDEIAFPGANGISPSRDARILPITEQNLSLRTDPCDSTEQSGAVNAECRWGVDDDLKTLIGANGISLSRDACMVPVTEQNLILRDDPCADPEQPGRTGAERCWRVDDPYSYALRGHGSTLELVGLKPTQWQDLIPTSLWENGRVNLYFVGPIVFLLLYWIVFDVNAGAFHRFYRDRLSRAYVFQLSPDGKRVVANDEQRLSELNADDTLGPYHLVNVALNLQGSHARDLRGRNADFFILSKCFSGSPRVGYTPTADLEDLDRHLNLATAMAISGAAAAPNMGVTTVGPLVFVMTLLNIRLGYWLPNPALVANASWVRRLEWRLGPGPRYLLKEAFGRLDERASFLNLSDGGHIENLAIYELLRRRCAYIIAIDGEADPQMGFGSLITLMRYARIDLGIRIELDLDPIRKDAAGLSAGHWVHGKIHYGDGQIGHLLYIKSSVTGDEPEYVRDYRTKKPTFPHESTADQFFDEIQFEAYRALGHHIGDKLFAQEASLGPFSKLKGRA